MPFPLKIPPPQAPSPGGGAGPVVVDDGVAQGEGRWLGVVVDVDARSARGVVALPAGQGQAGHGARGPVSERQHPALVVAVHHGHLRTLQPHQGEVLVQHEVLAIPTRGDEHGVAVGRRVHGGHDLAEGVLQGARSGGAVPPVPVHVPLLEDAQGQEHQHRQAGELQRRSTRVAPGRARHPSVSFVHRILRRYRSSLDGPGRFRGKNVSAPAGGCRFRASLHVAQLLELPQRGLVQRAAPRYPTGRPPGRAGRRAAFRARHAARPGARGGSPRAPRARPGRRRGGTAPTRSGPGRPPRRPAGRGSASSRRSCAARTCARSRRGSRSRWGGRPGWPARTGRCPACADRWGVRAGPAGWGPGRSA